MKRATSTAGMRAAIAALAAALALAFGAGPAVADNLHPYLVGHWNDSAFDFLGFKLRIINPTSDDLLAVVAVFDHDELPFACARVLLTQNDEALLLGLDGSPIWLPYGSPVIVPEGEGQNLPDFLVDLPNYPGPFEGVVKVVSLDPNLEFSLEERVKEGLLAWIMNASNVNLQLLATVTDDTDQHQSFSKDQIQLDFTPWSFPYNVELHGVPRRFLTASRNAELIKIAGPEACGSVGETFDPEFPEDVEPLDFFFPFTFDFVP